ncbi:uncharacterized protein BCR38DRAFT_60080 [Pseudomassariella vexata]|uniref:Uncharacterized protein n=1 Tax=Pseudomassariella vexata TaxID=1141098 RepID=A0A1Y2DKE7_9PEZI|nr:uncharacterized protein BCR38DRAFT_60080 [Pseudomassariella vexata]ORY59606.1 hypothetical protein BCR38DRAFT_60080 [Pseudomassariella vexata]
MMEILDKIHELRGQTALRRVGSDGFEAQKPVNHGGSDDEIPRIQYWGLSYGSILGFGRALRVVSAEQLYGGYFAGVFGVWYGVLEDVFC